MLTNSPAAIIALILVNYASSCVAQDAGTPVPAMHWRWEGLQAALAMSCRERGLTKREACYRHAKQARREAVAFLKASDPRALKWMPTVSQFA